MQNRSPATYVGPPHSFLLKESVSVSVPRPDTQPWCVLFPNDEIWNPDTYNPV